MHAARRVSNPVAWHRHVLASDVLGALRTDARQNLGQVAWGLALAARADGTTAPTWEGLVANTGLSRSSIARWLRFLHRRGLVETVVRGSTPQYRRGSALEGNLAAVYQLVVPTSDTPTGTSRSEVPLRARENGREGDFPSLDQARSRRQRLAAAKTFMERRPALRRGRLRAIAHVLTPYLKRGWTLSDLGWAVDVRPDGTRWTHTADVRCPHGWLAHRLSAWNGHQPPVTTARQASQVERDASKAFFEEHDRAAAVAVGAPLWFTQMRNQLTRRVGRRG